MGTTKVKWCERSLLYAPLYYTIVTSEKRLKAELKRLKYTGSDVGINPDKDATTNFLVKKGKTVAIVCLFNHSMSLVETLGLIVHEAVHIWQETKSILGESAPSKEFEAYSIQGISQNLIREYLRQTRRKL